MGKGKRKAERKARQALRGSTTAQDEAAARDILRSIEGGAPLKGRPEYEAQMEAWRESGSVPGPG